MIDVVFTDTHFGWKNNSMTWLNSQMDFIYKQFIPAIKQLSKTEPVRVIHCGDVFDSRSTISTYVATKVVQAFKDIRSVCDDFVIVCGNHDFYSPNSDEVNTVNLFMNNLDIKIVDKQIYETVTHAFVPWYVWHEGTFETDAKYVYTHADLIHDPIPASCIDKHIFAGHIHTPQTRSTRWNMGSCYSLNFADANSERGFYVIKDGDIKFVANKVSIRFHRLYNENILTTDVDSLDVNDYIELYVTESNMIKEDYINKIKEFTTRFSHLWIIPQVVINSGNIDEKFQGYDIETIMDNMIPDDLMDFYTKIKNKLNLT
jgi:DNA repair exonuclease SbcCD nuclease subunit